MKRLAIAGAAIVALTGVLFAQRATVKPLDIYVVDTEGGKAALWVAPSGQSLLIDSGNPGNRDLDRLMAAITDAGVKQIDFLISTHYHVDHIGGLQELAKRIPIAHFIDHGPNVEEREQVQGFQAAYAELYAKAKHTVVKPGDKVPIAGLDWRIVTSAGNVLKAPLTPESAKPNPRAPASRPKTRPPPTTTLSRSGASSPSDSSERSILATCCGTRKTIWCVRTIPSAPSTCTSSRITDSMPRGPLLSSTLSSRASRSCRMGRGRVVASRRSKRCGRHLGLKICGSCIGRTMRGSN